MTQADPKRKAPSAGAHQAMVRVIRHLRQAGYQALLAGGCVRDMLMDKTPHDYDVATNAVPNTIRELFPRTLMVGARFGVAVVLIGGRQIEVATFRSDQTYHDGRRPEKVVFTDARHDAERRDFTINGMFYDPIDKDVIDYVDGRADLKAGVIRAIGDPEKRFAEDHLRMLRAVRFAARLGFEIEPVTWRAMVRHAKKIQRISAERIAMELEMILTDPNRSAGAKLALDCGLLENIFETIPKEHLLFGMSVLAQLPKRSSFALAMSALLSSVSEKQAGSICRQLKTSNELLGHTRWLVGNQDKLLDAIGAITVGRLKQWLAEPMFDSLVSLLRSRLRASGKSDSPLRVLRRKINALGTEPIRPDRLLDGHALIRLGAAPGPMVGRLAEELYLAQLENQVRTRSQAEIWVQHWLDQHRQSS